MTLSNAVNGSFARAQATGTIRTDDGPSASLSDAQVKEGDFGRNELVFVITLSSPPPPGMDAQLSWSTADVTALAGSDYAASSGLVTFTNGSPLTRRLSVPILGDTVPEPNETFAVTLAAVANITVQRPTGVGTIVNDDLPTLSINDVTQLEGGAASTTPSSSPSR